MQFLSLKDRYSKVDIIKESADPHMIDLSVLNPKQWDFIHKMAMEIKEAQKANASVICAFGAHAIKNGLGRVIGTLLQEGWFTHICTNGAGIIHDWEFSYIGKSSEDVRQNVREGHFGTWQETGLYINLAIAVGAYEGLGYAESVGRMIKNDGLLIPSIAELEEASQDSGNNNYDKRAAAFDLISEIKTCNIKTGFMPIPHPFKEYSLQPFSYHSGRPFTCHPMFGHDIIYTHYANKGSAIGRTAERDFLSYADSVSNLEHGVYVSIGSAVMSPMIFEKALSMARNLRKHQGKEINDFSIHVMDLQEATWDWSKGEPPSNNPAYYQRFMKTFNRMGGRIDYNCFDNKLFFSSLLSALKEK